MQSGRSLEMQSALTIRMVQIDGGIARPDAPPTCLNHLIIDDHAYVAYPRTTVGCWARAHAVRSVRQPQSEVIRGPSEVIRGHHTCPLEKLTFTLPAIECNQGSSEAIHTCPLEKLAFTLPAIEPNSTA